MVDEGERPDLDAWLAEVKALPGAGDVGMYLCHNGVVRAHSRDGRAVSGMQLSVDRARLALAVEEAHRKKGVSVVRAWVNEGHLLVGDDIMYVLVGGDIREHVFDALQSLVRAIKTEVVAEMEERPSS